MDTTAKAIHPYQDVSATNLSANIDRIENLVREITMMVTQVEEVITGNSNAAKAEAIPIPGLLPATSALAEDLVSLKAKLSNIIDDLT